MTHVSRQVWWLNPAWVAGLMGVVVSIAAYLTPEAMYKSFWRTPKYFDDRFLTLCLGMTLLFCFGAVASMIIAKGPSVNDWKRELPWHWIERTFWTCVILSVAGYLAWAAVAVSRGATLNLALGVMRGEKGAAYEMKEVYLGTISGVTTLTQLGIAAVVLGVMLGIRKGWHHIGPAIGLVFALAAVRALFNSERLAIIELAIPALVISIRLVLLETPRFSARLRTVLQLTPIAGGVLVLGLFAMFEYFRSWTTFYAGTGQSFWQFVSLRFLGYYVTALNNGALMAARLDPIGAPFSVFHFLWRFPVIGGVTQALYPNLKLDNIDFDPYMQILDREANPEFNNSSALLPPVVDFGVPGALLFWLLAGLLCGLLYRWYLDGNISGLLFYPIFFTGVTETTRIMYWGEGRAVIVYFVLIPLAWACSAWLRRTRHTERRMAWLQSH